MILLGIFLTGGGIQAYANTRECKFLDRINCNDCSAPLMFKCGGDIKFVKPESNPNSLFVSVVTRGTLLNDPDGRKKKILLKSMEEAADDMDDSRVFRFKLKIPSSIGNFVEWTSGGGSTSKSRVRKTIAKRVHGKSKREYTKGEILGYIEDPIIEGVVFNMNDKDLYNGFYEKSGIKAEGFCYYSSVPQVVEVAAKEDRKQCNKKFCFAHIKCVKNNEFFERFTACSTLPNENDHCPSARECGGNPIDIRRSSNGNLIVKSRRTLPRAGTNRIVGSREGSVYTSQPKIVSFPFLDPEWNKHTCNSTQFCVADVNLGSTMSYADSSVACKARENECPPVKQCLDDKSIVVKNLRNPMDENIMGVSILAEASQANKLTNENSEFRGGRKGFDGRNSDSGRGFDGGERHNNMNDSESGRSLQ